MLNNLVVPSSRQHSKKCVHARAPACVLCVRAHKLTGSVDPLHVHLPTCINLRTFAPENRERTRAGAVCPCTVKEIRKQLRQQPAITAVTATRRVRVCVCVRLCWTLRTRREPLVEITFHLDSETTPFPGPLTPAARRCIGFTRARSQLCSLHFGKNGRQGHTHTHARARETSEAAGAS